MSGPGLPKWADLNPRAGAVSQFVDPCLFLIRLSARLSPDGEAHFGSQGQFWPVPSEDWTTWDRSESNPLVSCITDWESLPSPAASISGLRDQASRDLGWAIVDCARAAFEPLAPRINADILTSHISEPKIFVVTRLELLVSAGQLTYLETDDPDGVRVQAARLVFEAGLRGKLWPITDCIPEDMPSGLLESNDLAKQIWPETGRTIAQRYNGEVDALFEALRASVGAL